jgi:glycosyltransferase involved in cell wall biosynthesis
VSLLKRKLRIAICGGRGIPHSYSGTEALVGQLAPRLVARGHEITVYCRRSLFRERPAFYRGVQLIYLPSIETKVLGSPTHTLLCAFDVLFRKVDLVLMMNIVNGLHCAVFRALRQQCAIMVDGQDWKRGKWGRLARSYFHWCASHIGKICPRGVITDAMGMRQIYLDEFGTTSACIASGADIQVSTRPEVVREYGLKPFGYYLIASRLVPENNADLIIKAFERLHTDRVLAIAGTANYKSKFIERLKQTKDPRVRFLGHVADPEHMKELHCNTFAYVHGHSLGGVNPALLKALGCGNCVLALNTPFNVEPLQNYGILFEDDVDDLAQKLQHIEDHPEIAAEYRRRAPERIREAYNWEAITDQYEEFFLRLVAGEDPTRTHSSVAAANTGAAHAEKGVFVSQEASPVLNMADTAGSGGQLQ